MLLRNSLSFLSNDDFYKLSGLVPLDTIIDKYPKVTIYRHRVTSSAVALDVFTRISFIIRAFDSSNVDIRFGPESRVTSAISGQKNISEIRSGAGEISFSLDGKEYYIDIASISIVGGRKYK